LENANSCYKKSFNFVIVGTFVHQSKDDALEYLEQLLKKDKRFIDINSIHIFGEKILK
jgi:hypothetical protein